MKKKPKRDKAYWEKRSEAQLVSLLKDGDKALAMLDKDIERALADIDKNIRVLYQRYQDASGLSLKEAQKLIKGSDYKDWRMSIDEYMEKIDKTRSQALLLELNTLAYRSRITRLEALEAQIMAMSAILAQESERTAHKVLYDAFEETYSKGLYEAYLDHDPEIIRQMAKKNVRISKTQIEKVLKTPWSGANYSENIWANTYDIAYQARRAVVANIMTGASVDRLSKELSQGYGKKYRSNMQRLIRTEIAYIKGQADLATYKKLKIKEYEILATLDTRTSKICQSKDGEHYPNDEAVVGKTYPPFHPNCRTVTVAYRGDDYGDKTRAARDREGNLIKVPRGMKYDEWKKTYIDAYK